MELIDRGALINAICGDCSEKEGNDRCDICTCVKQIRAAETVIEIDETKPAERMAGGIQVIDCLLKSGG